MDEINSADEATKSGNRRSTTGVAAVLGVVLFMLLAIFITSRPTTGGPRVILAVLSLIFVALNCGTILCLRGLGAIGFGRKIGHEKLTALLLSTASIFLIGLNTLNQAGITDVVLTCVFVSIVYFYVIRRF